VAGGSTGAGEDGDRLVADPAGLRVAGPGGTTRWTAGWDDVAALWAPDRRGRPGEPPAVVVAVLTTDGVLRQVEVPTSQPRAVERAVRAVARATRTGPAALDAGPHLVVVVVVVVAVLAALAYLLVAAHRVTF
jgi:hypothetical protein